jgi:hypothetical protein
MLLSVEAYVSLCIKDLSTDLICITELVLELLIISLEEALAVAIVCVSSSSSDYCQE